MTSPITFRRESFNTVWNIVKTAWRDIRLHRLIDQEDLIERLENSTIELENAWANTQENEYNQFKESHINELAQIRKLLTGKNRKLYFDRVYHPRLTACNTRIFSNTFHISRINTFFSNLPTKIFSEFIKGITFFQVDISSDLERPPYHRPLSCGSSLQTFHEKFEITTNMTPSKIRKIKLAVRLCYIERMIYNHIYKYIMDRQDARHIQELYNLERLYQDYYAGHRLIIDIDIGPSQFEPSFMILIDSYDNNKFHIEETYQKERNGDVLCTRKTLRNSGHSSPFEVKKETKTQTFAQEVSWSVPRRVSP